MYDTTQVVGDFFEIKVARILGLRRYDGERAGGIPDLVSKDGSFYVEVKASAYSNGGVINKGQLYRFDENIRVRRFYAFAYHSIAESMQKDYPTKRELKRALDLRSLFLFPFSIVLAHFEKSKKRTNPRHDDFVQLKEGLARRIFGLDNDAWKHLGLNKINYRIARPHEKVHIITREGYLENEILDSFRPEFIREDF